MADSVLTLDGDPKKAEVVKALFEDLMEAIACQEKDDRQYNRRNLVRVFFAVVEGIVSWIKGEALSFVKFGNTQWTPDVLAMLREEEYGIRQNGKAFTRQKFIPTEVNLRFIIDLLAGIGPTPGPEISGVGWQAFKRCVEIRNRITHPKITGALLVNDDEIACTKTAMDWFKGFLAHYIVAVIAYAYSKASDEQKSVLAKALQESGAPPDILTKSHKANSGGEAK